MAINTHHVYNRTGSTVTVASSSVAAHSSAVLVLDDRDLATFHSSGCDSALLAPGSATADEIRGYVRGQ